jgi:Glycosyltransferase family 29 (sialyltransferase)
MSTSNKEAELVSRIAVVGNAISEYEFSNEIDSANIVVRFNNPFGLDVNNGSRTDIHIITNGGKTAEKWLVTPPWARKSC